jgi:hypothetical protein
MESSIPSIYQVTCPRGTCPLGWGLFEPVIGPWRTTTVTLSLKLNEDKTVIDD